MKCKLLSGFFACVCTIMLSANGQNYTFYGGPELSLEECSDWHRIEANQGIIKIENPNKNLVVSVQRIRHAKNTGRQLKKYLCRNGISISSDAFETSVAGRKAFGIQAASIEMRTPKRMLYIAIPLKDSTYLVCFKCPEDCYPDHDSTLKELLNSIKINDYSGISSQKLSS